MELEAGIGGVWIFEYVVNTLGIKGRGAAFYAVYLVTLLKQKLSEVRAILAGYSCNKRPLRHYFSFLERPDP